MTRVRLRGIYATALTNYLPAGIEVVQASDPIERRFETDFLGGEPDAIIRDTRGHQGVAVIGDADAVTQLCSSLPEIGIDTFTWIAEAPRSAVFAGEIIEMRSDGAIVDIGSVEGFLPYDSNEDSLSVGDEIRVQVHDPAPPWLDQRPLLSTEIRVFGTLLDLIRAAESPRAAISDPETAKELIRMTSLLSVDPPENWSIQWSSDALDADIPTLNDALTSIITRIDAVESSLENGGETAEETSWVWFGRTSRFALDELRQAVTTTMPGHHRIKAIGDTASAAVDFLEAICDPPTSFPVDVVMRQFGPLTGDTIRIIHGKPDGTRFPLGQGSVIDWGPDGIITVRREMTAGGTYDALDIPRESEDIATTKLKEGSWWYPTVYRDADGYVKGTYANICTPIELFPGGATYIDLEVDVIRYPDGDVVRVDDDDLNEVVANGYVSEELAAKARTVAESVERGLSNQ